MPFDIDYIILLFCITNTIRITLHLFFFFLCALLFRCCLITLIAKAEAPFVLRDCAVPYFDCIVVLYSFDKFHCTLFFSISFAHSFVGSYHFFYFISLYYYFFGGFSVTSIASMKPYSLSKCVVQYCLVGAIGM